MKDELAVIKLACEFIHYLMVELSGARFAAMVAANKAEPNPDICHSHDHCDANMVMFEAFVSVFGRDPAMQGDDLELVNKAWCLARRLLETEFK